jgi:DNA-binding transcriptional regulator YiaG
MCLDIETEGQRIREKHGLLKPEELRELRKKYNIDLETADALFGLSVGSYHKFETGEKLQSSLEDHLIRSTNPLDRYGFSILPKPKVIDY